jgi:hypothetical protein
MASTTTSKGLLMATFNAESRLNPSNLSEIEEFWDEELRELYGKAGRFIGTKAHYEKPQPVPPALLYSTEATTIASIEYSMAKQTLLEDCKEVTRRKTKQYECVWCNSSSKSS